jgi:hypothetical protein
VRFKNYASDGFDGQYDAYKMYAADASIPQLFTRIQGADDISINTLGTLSGSKTIPLGFKTTVAGTFTITADMVSSLTSNGNYVYLRDLDAGITQNLAANNTYVFTSGVTNGLKRFVLLFNPPITVFPTIALNSNSFTVAAGTTSIDLAYSGTNNNPDKYSIDFEAAANTAGFVDVTDAGLPTSPMTISIPSTVSPGIYHGTLTVKISSTGATSVNYPITIEVQPVFTTSQDIGTTLQLSWTPTTGVSSYTVQYRIPAGVWVGATAGSSNQIKLTNLTPESDYECKVTTYKNGASYVSQVGTLTTAVTSYNKNQDIGTTLEVSWPALAWASNFTFQYRKTGTTTWTGIPSTTNLVKISNLLPETEYECRVYVYKNNALWGIQQIGTFTTDKVDFVASSITTTSLTLTWNSFAPWATSYTLQYRLPAGVWMTKTTSSPTVALSNLVPASSYECRTYVYKSTLWGISQTGTFATAGGKAISDDNAGEDNQLSVYPNPFTEQMNMDVFVKENTKIIWSLYDMTGKLVLNGQESITAGYSSINIEAADLPKGVYMIKANLNDQVQSFRVMKQ